MGRISQQIHCLFSEEAEAFSARLIPSDTTTFYFELINRSWKGTLLRIPSDIPCLSICSIVPRIPSGNSILFGVCKNPQKDGNVGNHAILEPLFGIFFVGYCTWYTVKSSFMKTPAANLNRRKLQVEVEAWTVEVWESKVGSSLDSKV